MKKEILLILGIIILVNLAGVLAEAYVTSNPEECEGAFLTEKGYCFEDCAELADYSGSIDQDVGYHALSSFAKKATGATCNSCGDKQTLVIIINLF